MKTVGSFVSSFISRCFPNLFFQRALRISLERYFVECAIADELDVRTVTSRNFRSRFSGRSSTLFVLGASPSVNSVTVDQWGIVAESYSVGINDHFMFHDFEPTFMMYEGGADDNAFKGQVLSRQRQFAAYLSRSKVNLILKDINNFSKTFLESFLRQFPTRDRGFCIPKLIIPGSDNQSVYLNLLKVLNHPGYQRIPAFSRVSVTLAMSLALILGVKRIVLVGVDLESRPNFYEMCSYLSKRNFSPPPSVIDLESDESHCTVDPSLDPVTADESILTFASRYQELFGITTFVSSKSSRLYPRLKMFEWK